MRDMRGVIIAEGDIVIGIDVCCLDYRIGVVTKTSDTKGYVYLDGREVGYDKSDCLVLPNHYKEKVVE
jgi:hypothetical protein